MKGQALKPSLCPIVGVEISTNARNFFTAVSASCAIAWGSVGASRPGDGPTNYVADPDHRVGWALPPEAPAWVLTISSEGVLLPVGGGGFC